MAKNTGLEKHGGTITVVSTIQPKEYFVLKADKSLERIAEDAPTPEGHIAVLNPLVTGAYIEERNTLYPLPEKKVKIHKGVWQNVPKIPKGTKPYEFPDLFVVYMGV